MKFIHKFEEYCTLYKSICFHMTLQHMVDMFLNTDKRKKGRIQKSSE